MSKPKLTETRISYLDLLWSPINGCSECSPACDNPWHKYIFLTKRWERMCKLTHPMLDHLRNNGDPVVWGFTAWDQDSALKVSELVDKHFIRCDNVWLSLEPLLAPVSTRSLYLFNGVITGCEQINGGRTGRPAPRWWFRSLQYACHEDNRPFYLKQQGEHENGEGKVVHYPPKPEELAWELKRKPSLSHTETIPKEQP